MIKKQRDANGDELLGACLHQREAILDLLDSHENRDAEHGYTHAHILGHILGDDWPAMINNIPKYL